MPILRELTEALVSPVREAVVVLALVLALPPVPVQLVVSATVVVMS